MHIITLFVMLENNSKKQKSSDSIKVLEFICAKALT